MAKRRAGRSGFNMAEAIRAELTKNSELSLRECLEAVKASHPEAKLNEQSFGVAFSNQRRKLGLKPRRRGRTVKRRMPGVGRPAAASSMSGGLNMDLLQAARKFVAVAGGDADTAVAAVRALALLQIN